MYNSQKFIANEEALNFEEAQLSEAPVVVLSKALSQFDMNEDAQVCIDLSGVEKLDNVSLAVLVNFIFKRDAHRKVEIYGVSRAVEKAVKLLNLDRYVWTHRRA